MSVHTKVRPTNQSEQKKGILYINCNNVTYAIPKKIADKYIVSVSNENESVSAEVVFADLNKRFTKAGALLKGLRYKEGLTQVEFAKKIGVTQTNLSKMENGRRPIGKSIAKRIEQIFDVNYRYFLE